MIYRLLLMGHSSILIQSYGPSESAPGCIQVCLSDGEIREYGIGAIYCIKQDPCERDGHDWHEGSIFCWRDDCHAKKPTTEAPF